MKKLTMLKFNEFCKVQHPQFYEVNKNRLFLIYKIHDRQPPVWIPHTKSFVIVNGPERAPFIWYLDHYNIDCTYYDLVEV